MSRASGGWRCLDRSERLALAALTGLALLLRLPGLHLGLWTDEITSLLESFRPPLRVVLTSFPGDTQHPLYSALANACLKLFGESNSSIRLPALLFGVASIPALLALGRQVTSRREAWLAALLLCASYHHVWFSQTARGYTMLLFFALVSSSLLLRALRRDRLPLWCAYAVTTALGAYTHLTLAFLALAQVGVAVLDPAMRTGTWGRRARACSGFAIAALLVLLLYGPILVQVTEFVAQGPSMQRGVATPAWAIAETVRGFRAGFGLPAMLLAAWFLGWGAWSYARTDPRVLLLFVLPVLLIPLGSLLLRGTVFPRYLFCAAGFGLLLSVRGITEAGRASGTWLARRGAPRLPAAELLAAALVLASLASLPRIHRLPKQDFVGAAEWVDRNVSPRDRVLAVGTTIVPFRDYLGRTEWHYLHPGQGDAFRSVVRPDAALWVVYTFEHYLEAWDPGLVGVLRETCAGARVFPSSLGGGQITVCRLPSSPSAPPSRGTPGSAGRFDARSPSSFLAD